MLRRSIAGLFVPLLYLVPVLGQDAMQYHVRQLKIVAQDSKVRVLNYAPHKGEKTPMHSHPNLVVYSLTGGTIKSTTADGKTTIVTTKAGQVGWRDAQTHISENVGKTEIHALGIELKK